jgi:hypothetical protein
VCYTYKASILFFSLLLLPPFFAIAQTEKQTKCPPISITNNNTPQINPNFYFNPTSTINVVGMKIHDITITAYEKFKEKVTTENCYLLKKIVKKMLWERRYAIAGGSLIGSYSSISLLLLADYHYLQDCSLWSRWKSDCSFADLCAIPEKELEKELIRTIAKRNCNKKNPTDMIHPLISFINTIDTEIYRINRYISTASAIKKCRLLPFFPTNDTKIANAQRLLERAHFIKHIFLSWLAEYNLTSK